jgi:Ser/Thr protein kinase RdoA (MazF antagonist)
VQTLGIAARQALLDQGLVRPELDAGWLRASQTALEAAQAVFDEVSSAPGGLRQLRLHGDCHPGNVLWREEGEQAGPHFVDLDDCLTGPAIQDLWMLLPGDRDSAGAALDRLVEAYQSVRDLDLTELRLIEPLRTLRMLHHSAWIARRWHDPAFPRAFPWFGSPGYWAQQATELWEQVDRMAP